jgi:serine/threonine protein kinase/ABC-type branched-subunit amino acid transport system substrate-binding protein
MSTPLQGQIIAGRYRLERPLARGGMGSVWVARHLQLDTDVAVKLIVPERSESAVARERFEREAKASAQIRSPNVVQVHDYGVDGDLPFIVMELLEGEDLAARLAREKKLSLAATAAVLVPVCKALKRAHEAGLVHRDLKPGNIFLARHGDDEVPKVLDFGIAKAMGLGLASSSTKSGTLLGSPHYMSPEQVRSGKLVDHRTDLWSIGVIAFRCLTGERPFKGEEIGDVLVEICTDPIPAASSLCPELGEDVDRFFDRALSRNVDQRFQSARELGEALNALAASTGERPISISTSLPPVAAPAEILAELSTEAADEPEPTAADPDASTLQEPTSETTVEPSVPDPEPPPPPAARPRRWWMPVALLAAAFAGAGALEVARAARAGHTAPAASGSSVHHGCADNRACIAASGGKPAICRKDDGVCVPLETAQCKVLAGPHDVENDATLWVGAMFPISMPDPESYGPLSGNAVDLARRDFAETTGGVPSLSPGRAARPLAVVLCDDRENPARAAEHLVNDVRVPAIIGFARSKEVLDLATSLFVPKGVLALASNTASMLRDVPHAAGEPRLVFRTTTSADMVAPAVAALLAEVVEPEIRRAPGAPRAGEPIRVAVVRVNNASGQSMADRYVASLRFNGRSVGENAESFREVLVADAIDDEDRAATERAAAEVVALRPHVVLEAGAGNGLIPAVERLWPASERRRPRYLRGSSITSPQVLGLVRESPEARRRILGVDTVSSTAVLAKFVIRYNEVYTPRVTPQSSTSAPYDALYLLAYAAATLGDGPVTGPALARAIPRLLPPGDRVEVGPGSIYQAVRALGSGQNVDLEGTATSLDLDLETGDATADFAIYCIAPSLPGGGPVEVESGLFFRARSRKLEGTMRCP